MRYDYGHPNEPAIRLELSTDDSACAFCEQMIPTGVVFASIPEPQSDIRYPVVNGLIRCMWCLALELVALDVITDRPAESIAP